jgi:hypothetical protein
MVTWGYQNLKNGTQKNTEVRETPARPPTQSLKMKRVVEPQAERRISKNRTGLWPKTKSLPKWKAGKQQNSVAQGNDVRERG